MRHRRTLSVVACLAATAMLATACTRSLIPDAPPRVAILVVDDFTTVVEAYQPAEVSDPSHTLCAVPTNEVGGHGAPGDLPPGQHGELVKQVTQKELSNLNVDTSVVEVHQFNIPDFDLLKIITNLGDEVEALKQGGDYRAVIVNMSFVVLPCDLSDWVHEMQNSEGFKARLYSYLAILEADLAQALQVVINSLGTDEKDTPSLPPDSPLSVIILGALLAADSGSGLGKWLSTSPPSWNAIARPGVVLVAAAGNSIEEGVQGLPAPFAPAGWDGVVSVSASDDAGGIAYYSNSGEVMRSGTTKDGNGEPVLGTSFAAPRVSAWLAVKLATAGSINTANCTWAPLDYMSYNQATGWKNYFDLEGLAQGAHGKPSCPAIV